MKVSLFLLPVLCVLILSSIYCPALAQGQVEPPAETNPIDGGTGGGTGEGVNPGAGGGQGPPVDDAHPGHGRGRWHGEGKGRRGGAAANGEAPAPGGERGQGRRRGQGRACNCK
ncbi:hypothetical protein C0Q70_08446 [Pomacea canaliculata]|uniref:Uncharacterized protein n=1 Tax=Pomacea canaliculata TaxID=400727 RepID=A0A2T7PHV0_POMCA|nr:hypothetical protein C0Q70_08446 [Pomacea canaliculata]